MRSSFLRTRVFFVLVSTLCIQAHLPAVAQLFEDKPPMALTGEWYSRTQMFPFYSSRDQDPAIVQMISQINTDSIASIIQSLQDFGTRFLMLENRKEVAEWLVDKFISYGYPDVRIDSFLCFVNWGNIYVDTNIQYNVIATLPGASAPDEEYVIGGHYDSITFPDPEEAAPGANDNATAVAATMEIARIMKLNGYQPEGTIRFTLFAAEELGLYGSRYLAETARTNGTDIRFMYNMDMISNNPDSIDEVTMFHYPGTEWATSYAADIMEQYTSLNVFIPDDINTSSDSFPYWLWGYPAVYVEERDFSPHWHQLSDTIGNCNIGYCAEITRGACAFLMTEQKLPYPQGIYALSSPEGIDLHWNPTLNSHVAGYNIYRSGTQGTGYIKINASLVTQNAYMDTDLLAGEDRYYVVTTVNTEGEEGLPSPEVNGARFGFSDTLLVINTLKDYNITPDSILQFYDYILQGIPYTWFDLNLAHPLTLGMLSMHRHVLWLANVSNYNLDLRPSYSDLGNFFLNSGNMLVSAFNPCRLLENVTTYPLQYPTGSLMHEIFKVDSVKRVLNSMMFQAYPDEGGYDTLRVDSEKYLLPNFPGEIYNIDVLVPTPEASVIYRFDSHYSPGTPLGAQQDQPVGLEYMGDFKTILLSFPLYYIDTADAAEFLHYVMEEKFNAITATPPDVALATDDLQLVSYPNPFSQSTQFSYTLPRSAHVDLSIYDLHGNKMATLVAQFMAAGTHTIGWNAASCPAGLYFVRLQAGERVVVKKIGQIR